MRMNQINIRNMNNPEYLAVSESLKSVAKEGEGEFQWYKATQEMVKQGTCKIDKEDFVTLYVDNIIIGMIVITDDKYYFIDNSLEY